MSVTEMTLEIRNCVVALVRTGESIETCTRYRRRHGYRLLVDNAGTVAANGTLLKICYDVRGACLLTAITIVNYFVPLQNRYKVVVECRYRRAFRYCFVNVRFHTRVRPPVHVPKRFYSFVTRAETPPPSDYSDTFHQIH